MRDKLIPFIVGLAGLFCSGALFIVLQFCIRTARRQREKAVLTSAAETAAAREQARVGSSGNGVISPLLPVRPRSSNFLYNWATVRHGRMRNRRALEEELNEEEEDDDVETRSLRQRRKERVQQYPMYDYSKKRPPLKHTVGWGPGKATVEDLMRHKEEVRLKKLGQQHVVLEQVVQQPGQAVINSMEQAPSYHSFDLLDLWNTASSDHQGVWPALPYNQHPAALGAGLSGETPSTDHDATPRPSQDAGHGQPTRPKLTVLTALDGKPARGVAISRGQPNGGWVGARSWYPPRLTRDQSDGQHQQQHSTAHSSVSSTAFSFQSAASAMSTGRTDAHAVPSASAVAMPRQYGAHFEPPSEILSYEHHPITRAWDRERERQQLTAPTYKEVTAPHTYVSPSPAPLWHQSPSGQATMQDRDREQDDDRVHGFRNAGLEIRGHVDHRYPPPARGIAHGRP